MRGTSLGWESPCLLTYSTTDPSQIHDPFSELNPWLKTKRRNWEGIEHETLFFKCPELRSVADHSDNLIMHRAKTDTPSLGWFNEFSNLTSMPLVRHRATRKSHDTCIRPTSLSPPHRGNGRDEFTFQQGLSKMNICGFPD